jgi:hypothetical protein
MELTAPLFTFSNLAGELVAGAERQMFAPAHHDIRGLDDGPGFLPGSSPSSRMAFMDMVALTGVPLTSMVTMPFHRALRNLRHGAGELISCAEFHSCFLLIIDGVLRRLIRDAKTPSGKPDGRSALACCGAAGFPFQA